MSDAIQVPSSVVKEIVRVGPCASSTFHGASDDGRAGAGLGFGAAWAAAATDNTAIAGSSLMRTSPPGACGSSPRLRRASIHTLEWLAACTVVPGRRRAYAMERGTPGARAGGGVACLPDGQEHGRRGPR